MQTDPLEPGDDWWQDVYKGDGPGGVPWQKLLDAWDEYAGGKFHKSRGYSFVHNLKNLAQQYRTAPREFEINDLTKREWLHSRVIKDVLEGVFANDSQLFREIADALDLFEDEGYEKANEAGAIAYVHNPLEEWRLMIVLYLLRKQKPIYTIREFVDFLNGELGKQAPSRDSVKDFCKRELGIRTDPKPGRPKK